MKTDLSNFKRGFRVAKGPEWAETEPEERQWLWQIPCKKATGGHIYTHSHTHLGYQSELNGGHGKLKTKLRKIKWVELVQEGDGEFAVIFPVEKLDEIADAVQARRRKVLSDKERARVAKLGRETLARNRAQESG